MIVARPPLDVLDRMRDGEVLGDHAAAAASWVVVTGGGSGIGRALVHHFSKTHLVLTCGRRAHAIEATRANSPHSESVHAVVCDIGTTSGRDALVRALPAGARLDFLVHNAAIGDPASLPNVDIDHFEESLRVNVVAPLALSQSFLPALTRAGGRILHLGTSVAHHPQQGTATYGVTKSAFHRLFLQMNVEGLGVPVGSLSPGLVDTEGVREHVAKARSLTLPHVRFFDDAFEKQWTTPLPLLLQFVDELLAMDADTFGSREWRFSEWRKEKQAAAAHEEARRGLTYGEWKQRMVRDGFVQPDGPSKHGSALVAALAVGAAATAMAVAVGVSLRRR